MSKCSMWRAAAGLALGAALIFGQTIPVAKQPQVKSKKEGEAVQAIFAAQDPDARIKAAQELVTKFADSEFKTLALQIIAMTYQQKNDAENMIVWGEKVIESDPKNFASMLMLATTIAQRTRENDLDREERLGQAEKYARTAMELIKDAPRPRPDVTDEQWNVAKKDSVAEAHAALGFAALARKKNDVAMAEWRIAFDMWSAPDPRVTALLGQLYNGVNKYDDAILVLDKTLAQPELHPQIKQFAESQKNYAVKMKAAGVKPTPPPASPNAPPQVEVKKP